MTAPAPRLNPALLLLKGNLLMGPGLSGGGEEGNRLLRFKFVLKFTSLLIAVGRLFSYRKGSASCQQLTALVCNFFMLLLLFKTSIQICVSNFTNLI